MTETADSMAADIAILRNAFAREGLDPDAIWAGGHATPSAERAWLAEMLRWVEAYRATPVRAALERRGFVFPPVDPDCDPDTDWLHFERWMRGQAREWRFAAEFGSLVPPDGLGEEEAAAELERVSALLASRNVEVCLQAGVPAKLAYAYVHRILMDESFEHLAEGSFTHLDGCSGYCPDCIQRPWCDVGREEDWPEDEEAGAGRELGGGSGAVSLDSAV